MKKRSQKRLLTLSQGSEIPDLWTLCDACREYLCLYPMIPEKKSYMEETGEGYFDWDFDLNDDELMAELAGRFHATNAGPGG